MTLDLTEDVDVILSTDGFGETVNYSPLGKPSRDIVIKFFDADMRADPYSNEMTYTRPAMLVSAAEMTDLTQGAAIVRDGVIYNCLMPDPNLAKVMPFILVELAKQ